MNIHAGHRSRLRDRFMKEGLSGFSEHEILELLLTYAIPQRDVNPLAHALITRFGSLSGVLDAGEHELMQVDGIGKNAASLLCLMPELLGAYQKSNPKGEETLPYPMLEVQQCRFCEACVKLCPTQALKIFSDENEQKHLLFHPALCQQCQLCEKVCMEKGIFWGDFISQSTYGLICCCLHSV